MTNKYNFIDLFSGCGGFSTGLELAGHKCLLGVDFQKEAVNSFAINHPRAHALHTDIRKLTKKKLTELIDFDEVDMVVGGPPCQGFSTVGKGIVDDERNALFKEFVRVVKITNPKIVLFENVTGILANKNKYTLHNIFKSFEKIGYHMSAQVMSADEYGVPSRRRRAIIMGVKGGAPRFPKQTHGTKKPFVTVEEAFSNLQTKKGEILNHDLSMTEVKNEIDKKRLKYIPAGSGIRYERDEKSFLPPRLRYKISWDEVGERRFRQTRLQRVPLDRPAPTILTSRTMYYHPIESRYLTVREAAKLQSFPNDFEFAGSVTAQFRQIGNAVPPILAKAIGKEIKKIDFSQRQFKKNYSTELITDIGKEAFSYRN